MSVMTTDIEPTVTTHTHFCLSCRTHFDCSVPFCDTMGATVCDRCNFDGPQESEPRVNYEALAQYMRERGA
jgi:hypothetical protein